MSKKASIIKEPSTDTMLSTMSNIPAYDSSLSCQHSEFVKGCNTCSLHYYQFCCENDVVQSEIVQTISKERHELQLIKGHLENLVNKLK